MDLAADLVVRRARVATCDRGASDPGYLEDHAVAVAGDAIAWIGPDARVEEEVDLAGARAIDARGRLVTPGLVDAHTHLVFGDDGARAAEFASLAAGRSYEEIARAGGGILATARATRAADDEALLWAAAARARRLLAWGVTTVEVKSGYGLEVEAEVRLLRVVRELARALRGEMTVVPTLLAAHAAPEEAQGGREGWIRRACDALVPAVAAEGLAAFCDAFVAPTAFTAAEARRVLEAGRAHGLVPRLHADQLGDGGAAALAAELGALLPASTLLARGTRYAPGRRLLDAGVRVALATNVNPGTSMSENVGLTLSLACVALGLTPDEALVAFTDGGARALRLADVGRIAPGAGADLVVWGARGADHLCWHAGVSHALLVVKAGRVVHQAEAWTAADCVA